MTQPAYEAPGVVYRVATRDDDADLRDLLRRNPMDGWVSLSMEREPDYFRPLIRGEDHVTIICRDRETGRPVGMCARSVRTAYVNGEARPLGYLGELRVMPAYRNRIRIIRDGFAALKTLAHEPVRTPFYVTAIVSDNHPARRLLESGRHGLPTYRPYAAITTLAMATAVQRRGHRVEAGRPSDLPAIAACLARNHRHQQFASVWTEDDLRDAETLGGPGPQDFLVLRRAGDVCGCLALWDQSKLRQTVVRGYDRRLGRVRPLVNLLAPLTGLPHLPAVNKPLKQVFLSHVAVDDDDPDVLVQLVAAALMAARQRGFTLALLGLARDSRLCAAIAAAFRARSYESQLYLVHWADGAAAADGVDGRPPRPEIGLL